MNIFELFIFVLFQLPIQKIICEVKLPAGWTTYDEYCAMKNTRCLGKVHTVCDRSRACGPIEGCNETRLSNDIKQSILDRHNEFRNLIANGTEKRGGNGNGAMNINVLNWDNELYFTIACHQNRCKFGHDKCRHVKRFNVGQNLAMQTGGTTDPKTFFHRQLKNMYEEIKYTEPNDLTAITKRALKFGHYTAMIWAKTKLVGCSFHWNDKIFLGGCNYGPTGNTMGERVYIPVEEGKKEAEVIKCEAEGGRNDKWSALCGKTTAILPYDLYETSHSEKMLYNLCVLFYLPLISFLCK